MSMKNILSYMPKKLAAALVVVTVALGFASMAVATYGPDRPTRAWSTAENGFDHITFNSYTGVDNGIGDERDFLRGEKVGYGTGWIDPINGVAQNDEIRAKIYIHNNANPTLNTVPDGDGFKGIAEDVKVKVELPNGIETTHDVKALIGASNASPLEIFDTLSMTGANGGHFELDYIPGSAKMFDRETNMTTDLSDNLVTTGVTLPDQKGCFEFVREITFRMKVKMPHYQIFKSVRFEGQGEADWKEAVTAQPGQMLEWKIDFKNIGQTALQNVAIVDDMPKNMLIESGSVNGNPANNGTIQQGGKQLNILVVTSDAGTDKKITFKSRTPSADKLDCGTNQLVNAAFATPQGFHTINDKAQVTIVKECSSNTPQYSCDAVSITKLGGRKVRVDVSKTALPANRVSVKNYEYNFGDGTTALVTDKNPVEYTFAKDGTFKVSVKVSFTVDGQTKTSEKICEAVVTFTTPKELPNTGAGSMIGALTAISIVGMLFHRAWTLRQTR